MSAEDIAMGFLLRVVAILVAFSTAVIVPLVMCVAAVIAIFDPVRAIDLIDRMGEEISK